MDETRELLRQTAEMAADFLASLDERPVFPRVDADDLRGALGGPLPDEPTDPREVIAALREGAEPGVVAIPSGRYFGFVIGGSVPAALAADWLTSTWDQNAGLYAAGPSAAVVEEIAGGWLRELLGIPAHASFAFVTGCQMAHVTALAAARQHVLAAGGLGRESRRARGRAAPSASSSARRCTSRSIRGASAARPRRAGRRPGRCAGTHDRRGAARSPRRPRMDQRSCARRRAK